MYYKLEALYVLPREYQTKSNLQCPARTTKTSVVGYKALEDYLVQFEKLGHDPIVLI